MRSFEKIFDGEKMDFRIVITNNEINISIDKHHGIDPTRDHPKLAYNSEIIHMMADTPDQ